MKQLRELRSLLERARMQKYTYCSEGQSDYDIVTPIKLNIEFSQLIISDSLDIICLKENNSCVMIKLIKSVEYVKLPCGKGIIIKVKCINYANNKKDLTYVIVATRS